MVDVPERIWIDPDAMPSECEKKYGSDVEYVRSDLTMRRLHKMHRRAQKAEGKLARMTAIIELLEGWIVSQKPSMLDGALSFTDAALKHCNARSRVFEGLTWSYLYRENKRLEARIKELEK